MVEQPADFKKWLNNQQILKMEHVCEKTPIKVVVVKDTPTTRLAHNVAKVDSSAVITYSVSNIVHKSKPYIEIDYQFDWDCGDYLQVPIKHIVTGYFCDFEITIYDYEAYIVKYGKTSTWFKGLFKSVDVVGNIVIVHTFDGQFFSFKVDSSTLKQVINTKNHSAMQKLYVLADSEVFIKDSMSIK